MDKEGPQQLRDQPQPQGPAPDVSSSQEQQQQSPTQATETQTQQSSSSSPNSSSQNQTSISPPATKSLPATTATTPMATPEPAARPKSAQELFHPKNKRKRTNSHDKEILEAAYRANPKPDKAARLEIVKKVSLNEKEVQIWFQNRRQNDRRKSRPLTTDEFIVITDATQVQPDATGLYYPSPAGPAPSSSYSAPPTVAQTPAPAHMQPPSQAPMRTPMSAPERVRQPPLSSSSAGDSSAVKETPEPDSVAWERRSMIGFDSATPSHAPPGTTRSAPATLTRTFSGDVGYLANRWNTGSAVTTPRTPFTSDTRPLPPPTSSSSQPLRLSLSLDGKAELVSNLPSPPRPTPTPPLAPPPIPRAGLQRSYSTSAVCCTPSTPITLPPLSSITSSLPPPSSSKSTPTAKPPLPPRLTRGRSLDVSAWEFCCDSESKGEDALSVQAKLESQNARDAMVEINLVRSTGGAGAYLGRRRGSLGGGQGVKRPRASLGTNGKVGVLGVKGGSVLNQQQRQLIGARAGEKVDLTGAKPPAGIQSYRIYDGDDSDKENWSPEKAEWLMRRRRRRLSPGPGATTSASPTLLATGRRPLPSTPSVSAYGRNPRRTDFESTRTRLARDMMLSTTARKSHTAPAGGSGSMTDLFDPRPTKRSPPSVEVYRDDDDDSDIDEEDERSCEESNCQGDEAEGRDGSCCRSSPTNSQASGRSSALLDEEVERFMQSVSPSKKSDADAVAGLLSLSQGNWR